MSTVLANVNCIPENKNYSKMLFSTLRMGDIYNNIKFAFFFVITVKI